MEEKNKKVRILKFIVFIIVLLFAVYLIYPQEYFYKISYDEIEEVIQKNNKIILVIGKEHCPYCEELIDRISSDISNKKQKVYYFEMNKEDIEIKEKIIDKFGDFEYVPHVLYIENGKIKKIKSSDDYENIYQDFWEF